MRRYYTIATLTLLQQGQDISTVLTGLRQAMERRGHMYLYGRVLKDVARAWERYEAKRIPTVQLAREQDLTVLADSIKRQLAALKAPSEYRVTIAPELIGGSVVRYDHHVIDTSYKDALVRLYQNIAQTTT